MRDQEVRHRAFVVRQPNSRWRFMRDLPEDFTVENVKVVTITGQSGFDPRWPAEFITTEELYLYQNNFTLKGYDYRLEDYRSEHGTRGGKIAIPSNAPKEKTSIWKRLFSWLPFTN